MQNLKHSQNSAYSSPWPLGILIKTQLWEWFWFFLCRWTPKPFNSWRIFCLRMFGAKIYGRPFVHQRARITHPWRLSLHDRSCLGDGAVAYTLGHIVLREEATVAQEAYLCTGTHDFSGVNRELITGDIEIGRLAFVGARAFIMPGVALGEAVVVGACSVVVKSVLSSQVVVGNPARPVNGALSRI